MGVDPYHRDLCRLNWVLSRALPATLSSEEEHFRSSVCDCCDHRDPGFPICIAYSALQQLVKPPTIASADFCPPIPSPHDNGSQWQVTRSPRVMHVTFTLIPAASTSAVSVQDSGFEDIGLLTHCKRLVCDFYSSGQCFAFSFLQIPPRDGHPCRSANRSPCRAGRGLAPPSLLSHHHDDQNSARQGATRHAWRTKKKARRGVALK